MTLSRSQSRPQLRKPRTDDRILWDVSTGIALELAVLVAHDLGLFSLLADGSRRLEEVCSALNIASRPADVLLSVCTSLDLARVQDGLYSLSPTAEEYLLESSPTSFGGFLDLEIAADPFRTFERLKKAVLTDAPQMYGGGDMWKLHAQNDELAQQFAYKMHGHSMGAAMVWPTAVDLSRNHVMLDIGGGSGAHAIGAAAHWPELEVIVLDLASVCGVADEYIRRYQLQDRVRTLVGDMWEDPFPAADVHFYSDIFHDWPLDKCRFLTRKSFDNLPSGGRLIVHEMLYNNDRTGPRATAAYSVQMVMFTKGRQFSGAELATMFTEAGFGDIQIEQTFGYRGMVTARKP